MLVEGVKETVTKTPEEEQDGDQENGENGLTQRQFGSSGAASVVSLERAPLDKLLEGHGGETMGTCEQDQAKGIDCRSFQVDFESL